MSETVKFLIILNIWAACIGFAVGFFRSMKGK